MRFNWATSFQTWKCKGRSKLIGEDDVVSIGPRLFRHGNRRICFELPLPSWVSIGPRPFRHGNVGILYLTFIALTGFNWATSFQTWKYAKVCWSILAPIGRVSIGPRPFRHGNAALLEMQFVPNVEFQLGHVLSDMEIAAIFLALLLSEKTRDTSSLLTIQLP